MGLVLVISCYTYYAARMGLRCNHPIWQDFGQRHLKTESSHGFLPFLVSSLNGLNKYKLDSLGLPVTRQLFSVSSPASSA
jgi:hypothetical protein